MSSAPHLVTGANGFLGAAVVRALLADGAAVRVFVRPRSDRRNLVGLRVEIAEGDLTDAESVHRAVQGCAAVYHVAADYRLWVADPAPMYRTNVEGSVNVVEAAAAAGVQRMVYTSSVAVLGINKDRSPADESTPVGVADMIGHYKRSKFLAEEAVRRQAVAAAVELGHRERDALTRSRIERALAERRAQRQVAFERRGTVADHAKQIRHRAELRLHGVQQRLGTGGRGFDGGGSEQTRHGELLGFADGWHRANRWGAVCTDAYPVIILHNGTT